MSVHLLIDAYNLMGLSEGFEGFGQDTLEEARDKLIENLAHYRGFKGVQATLVFDGGKGGYPTRRQERQRGLTIIYSKLGEEADHVIKAMVSEKRKSFVVVTSDNEIKRFAETKGCLTVNSQEFQQKMEMAVYMSEKGLDEEEEEYKSDFSTKKKGNPRRRSKKERKRNSILRKI